MTRVLVVYKKSAYQLHILERRDPHLLKLLRRRQPDAVNIQRAHDVHQRTLDAVAHSLRNLGVAFDLIYRANLKASTRYALVVSVGGDGTLLQASHVVSDTPILGVNSDPSRSEAVFCAATRRTFEALFQRALGGVLPPALLYRLRVRLNGRRLEPLALNDVLIAHDDPATLNRYRLTIGSRHEEQKSSGLWIASAAGSSSAILAAGGQRLPWTAKRFQYRPRELYEGRLSHNRLVGGALSSRQSVDVTWLMRQGALWIDGPHAQHPIRFGDRIRIELSPQHPLRLLGKSRLKT